MTPEEQLTSDRNKLKQDWDTLRQERASFEQERKDCGIEYKLFFGNLDEFSTEEDVKEYCAPFGVLKEVFLLKDNTGRSKRSCFAKFYSRKAADACMAALNGNITDKNALKPLVIRYADKPNSSAPGSSFGLPPGYPPSSYGPVPTRSPVFPPGSVKTSAAYGPPGSNLYVNNLAPNSTEQDVQDMFADFGTVLSAKVFAGHNYGFVSYDNPQSAQYAIQSLNGLQLGDSERKLEVSLKKEGGAKNNRFSPY